MKVEDLKNIYLASPETSVLVERLSNPAHKKFNLKGISGSFESLLASIIADKINRTQVFILNDREEAVYFLNDMENILGEKVKTYLFPTSYKRAYIFEEIDNANILLRTEALNAVNENRKERKLIITYPEALPEKVINQQSLVKNTFGVKVGDELDVNFLEEILVSYGFAKTDFVYEPGNFSIRGGIIDVFSFSPVISGRQKSTFLD